MHIFIDKYLGGGWSAVALTLIFGLEVWWCVLVWGFLFGLWKLGEGVVLLRFLWFRARTKRTEILYIFLLGIHTANVVQLENRMEQKERLAAA